MPQELVTAAELQARVGLPALIRQWGLSLAGVGLGIVTAVLTVGYGGFALVSLAASRVAGPYRRRLRAKIDSRVVSWADLDVRRITRFHGPVCTDPLAPRRSGRYLALRWSIGLLGAGVLGLLLLSVIVAASMISAWVFDGGWGLIENGAGRVDGVLLASAVPPGILIIFVAVMGVPAVGSLDRWWAARELGRDSQRLLALRVTELATSREQVLDAVNDERRRIERDLHDGLQQRLVALGLLIGRAERAEDAARRTELLRAAQLASHDAITDLRQVANRVYPVALDSDGLGAALESLTERAGIRIQLCYDLGVRLRPAVETAVYFAVSEAVTNAVKHGQARSVQISVTAQAHDRVLAVVSDDGRGGADPTGRGLSGLAGGWPPSTAR